MAAGRCRADKVAIRKSVWRNCYHDWVQQEAEANLTTRYGCEMQHCKYPAWLQHKSVDMGPADLPAWS